MPRRHSIRVRKIRRGVSKQFDLQLTSMLDILVILLVFLLKSFQTTNNTFTSLPGMEIPYSHSQDSPPDSLHVLITLESITFENQAIVQFEGQNQGQGKPSSVRIRSEDLDEGGRRIVPLFDALTNAKQKSEVLRAKSNVRDAQGNPLPFDGVLAIQADRRVSYDLLRKVMYTAGAAGYKVFRLLALRRDS